MTARISRDPPRCRWRARRVGLLVGVFLAFWGSLQCSGEEPDYQGELVSVTFDDKESMTPLCAGTIPYFDRFVREVFNAIEEPIPSGFHIPIHITDDYGAVCPEGSAGCLTWWGDVYLPTLRQRAGSSFLGPVAHEMVHAITLDVWGKSDGVFMEGIAEAYGRAHVGSHSLVPSPPAAALRQTIGAGWRIPRELYGPSARLTHYLITTYGIERYRSLYRRARARGARAIDRIFEAIYGETLDSVLAEFSEQSLTCTPNLHWCLAAAEPVALVDEHSEASLLSCHDPGAIGHWDSQWYWARTFKVEEGGRFHLESSLPWSALVHCGSCEGSALSEGRTAAGGVTRDLAPGVYALVYSGGSVAEQALDLEIRRLP